MTENVLDAFDRNYAPYTNAKKFDQYRLTDIQAALKECKTDPAYYSSYIFN